MDKEDIITEVPEVRSPGDGLTLEAVKSSEDAEDTVASEQEDDGPWNEYNIVEGLKSTLNSGFMSDLSVTVREEKFPCHAYILGMASPKFARMIKTNPHELQLPDVTPTNFRSLLDIIYSGEASELETDLVNTLYVRKDAKELKVYKAVEYCTQLFRKHLNAQNVCSVLDISELVNETEMKSCIKIIQERTDDVLKSEKFLNCEVATLELILKQDVVHNVSEVDLYMALNYWALTRELQREKWGSILGLIRFHMMRPQDMVINLTTLLNNLEKQNLFHYCKDEHNGENPDEISNEKKKRHRTWSMDRICADTEEIYLYANGSKYVTNEELTAIPPLRISLNEDAFLIGVKQRSERGGMWGQKYMEDVEVTLKDDNGTLISTATSRGLVQYWSNYEVKFPHAVELRADVTYELHSTHNVSGVKHATYKHDKGVNNSNKTSLQINVLEEEYSPILHLIIATKSD